MKATETRFFDFLRKSPQFSIPIYQRTYSWTEPQCRQLWDDILRAGRDERINSHFMGSIVYIEGGLYQVSTQSQVLVIDGQQRLTTVSLLLEALARKLGDGAEPVDGFSAKKLRNYYLLNSYEKDEQRYKLLLTQTDKKTLLALLDQEELPEAHSLRLKQNFEFFEKQLASLGDKIEALCKGLTKLMVVDISLSRDQDNPQLIFESMNSTGLELSQADLIRNFVLMGLEPEHQAHLYKKHWRPMEIGFGQEAYGDHFDGFMRHYLTMKTGEIPNVKKVYEAFKAYARGPEVKDLEIDELVADIHTFSGYYCNMALGKESDPTLATVFSDLREFKVNVAYPMLLELYQDYTEKLISRDELVQVVRWVESYVFRRAVCEIPTNSLNKTFANFGRELVKERYMESLQAHFLLLPSYRRFPRDDEFRREMERRNLYNFRSRSYWLRRIENHGRKERVPVSDYTIEHIMPQNPNLSPEWRKALGDNWETVHDTFLHTLGNLTLTGYNSEYSDHSFEQKREMRGGFKESPLWLNNGLGQMDTWNEDRIQERAERLSQKAVEVWGAPRLFDEQIDAYRPEKNPQRSGYRIEDHEYLAGEGPTRQLFKAFRKEVLSWDPCITEEFLKRYVAYKAETNFADIVPLANRLRIIINIEFHELHDPRNMTRDVSDIGSLGNGDVEVYLASEEDLPYIMGLVRQGFEKQMGEGGDLS